MTGHHRNPPAAILADLGCTKEQWIELRDIGLRMFAAGKGTGCSPLNAFRHQRICAGHRGIGWELTIWEWWTIWRDSGHWHERGAGRAFAMCRFGDVGPYAIGNVFIGPGDENSAAPRKKYPLPMGVSFNSCGDFARKPYRALGHIRGKKRHIGVYSTADEAHLAYLNAIIPTPISTTERVA